MENKMLLESTPYEGLKNGTHIDVELYYSKGVEGITPRGYYVSVTPVTRKNGMKSFVMFTGTRKLLFETSRYSVKQFEQAAKLAREEAPALVQAVLDKERAA